MYQLGWIWFKEQGEGVDKFTRPAANEIPLLGLVLSGLMMRPLAFNVLMYFTAMWLSPECETERVPLWHSWCHWEWVWASGRGSDCGWVDGLAGAASLTFTPCPCDLWLLSGKLFAKLWNIVLIYRWINKSLNIAQLEDCIDMCRYNSKEQCSMLRLDLRS